MTTLRTELAALLPEAKVGTVQSVEPIIMGLSGASVYAVRSSQGELVLRVNAQGADGDALEQQQRVLQRAADKGVAPALLHVDTAARATVSRRVEGVPLAAALADPAQRQAVIGSIVSQLRTLHTLDASGLAERDPVAFVRAQHGAQRDRPGYPDWARDVAAVVDGFAVTLQSQTRRVLSHNDLNPGNVLWDGQRAWLVDWEVAGLGHPFYDLATLAMFLQMDQEAALGLLAAQEQRPIDADEAAAFAALRRLAALASGHAFLALLPDLRVLPAHAPTLAEFYGALRAGALDLLHPDGQAAFGLALLRVGVGN